jgi:hypothetical protein
VLRPTNGELLRAVHVQLADQVLPALADGDPRRQLKSALHLLRRLERSWDRQSCYLEADNADLADTLGTTLHTLSTEARADYAQLRTRLEQVRNQPPDLPHATSGTQIGVNDPGLSRLMAINHTLQEILADLQATLHHDRGLASETRKQVTNMIRGLHRRLLDRAAEAAGTGHGN